MLSRTAVRSLPQGSEDNFKPEVNFKNLKSSEKKAWGGKYVYRDSKIPEKE